MGRFLNLMENGRKRTWKRILFVPSAIAVAVVLVKLAFPSGTVKNSYSWSRGEETRNQGAVSALALPSVEEVRKILQRIKDPELDANIVELGMVYQLAMEGRTVNLTMTLTTPKCPYGPELIESVKKELFSNAAIERVELQLTMDPPWSAERMSPGVMDRLMGAKTKTHNHGKGGGQAPSP
jgi:metal-sulfur cluster biosynthetic enzyme